MQTDPRRIVTLKLGAGTRSIVVTKLGYAPDSLMLMLRAGVDTSVDIELHARSAELASVMVTATRGQRRVEDEPTCVDVLGKEEVAEQTAMNPGKRLTLSSRDGRRPRSGDLARIGWCQPPR